MTQNMLCYNICKIKYVMLYNICCVAVLCYITYVMLYNKKVMLCYIACVMLCYVI